MNGLKRRIGEDILTPEEQDVFTEYILQMGMRKKSTELCVYKLLAPMAYAQEPLCQKLPQLGKPIAFMYGEFDWVGSQVAYTMLNEG